MLLRVTEGRGNLTEYVIARSAEDSFALLGTDWAISYNECHCEERSDVAISTFSYEIASPFQGSQWHAKNLPRFSKWQFIVWDCRATLATVDCHVLRVRNDNV